MDNRSMESVPEEKNQIPNDNDRHENSSNEGGEVFSTIEIIEAIGVFIFGVIGIALHDAEYGVLGYIFDFLAIWCGIAVVNHRIKNSKFRRVSPYFYWPSVCLAFLLFVFLSWSVSFKSAGESNHHGFSIIALETTVELKNPNHFLLWADGNQTNVVIAPIPVFMWVEFTNLKDVSMSISSCQFECKSKNGTWVAMQVIDPAMGWIYYTRNGDLHHATRYNPGENVFPAAFRAKEIRPGEPIAAWVFLEPPTSGFDGSIRFRIKNSADNESVEFVGQRNMTNMLATKTLRGPPFILLGPDDFRDISAARLVD